jgi:hypothetical protein
VWEVMAMIEIDRDAVDLPGNLVAVHDRRLGAH